MADYLELVDDYEEEAYSFFYEIQACQHYDCREPNRGPYIERLDGIYCKPCFLIHVKGYDPMDAYED